MARYQLNSISNLEPHGTNVHFFRTPRRGYDDHAAIYIPRESEKMPPHSRSLSSKGVELDQRLIDIAHQAIAYVALNGSVDGFPDQEFGDP
jgi:hypothetical protein